MVCAIEMSGNSDNKPIARRHLLKTAGVTGGALIGGLALSTSSATAEEDDNGTMYCHAHDNLCPDVEFERGTRVRVKKIGDPDPDSIEGSVGTWSNCCMLACGPFGFWDSSCDDDCSKAGWVYYGDEGIVRGTCSNNNLVLVEWDDTSSGSSLSSGDESHIDVDRLKEV